MTRNLPWIWFSSIRDASKEISTIEEGSANICRVGFRERHIPQNLAENVSLKSTGDDGLSRTIAG
jgi:hypothetical protein